MNDYLLGILIRERQQQLLKESEMIRIPKAENGPGRVERIVRRLLSGITGRKTVAGRPSPPAGTASGG